MSVSICNARELIGLQILILGADELQIALPFGQRPLVRQNGASDRWFVRTGWFLCSLVSVMSVGRKHDNLYDIFKDIVDEAVLLRDSAAP